MGAPGFWDNQEMAKPIISEVKILKATIDPVQAMLQGIDDVKALYELSEEVNDQASREEADGMLVD